MAFLPIVQMLQKRSGGIPHKIVGLGIVTEKRRNKSMAYLSIRNKDDRIYELEAKVEMLLENLKRIQKQERLEEGIYEQLDLFEYISHE